MSEIYLGIIGGGQLGSLLAVAAKKIHIKTIIYCDDINAPAQNFCDEFIFGEYNDKNKILEFNIWFQIYGFKSPLRGSFLLGSY